MLDRKGADVSNEIISFNNRSINDSDCAAYLTDCREERVRELYWLAGVGLTLGAD